VLNPRAAIGATVQVGPLFKSRNVKYVVPAAADASDSDTWRWPGEQTGDAVKETGWPEIGRGRGLDAPPATAHATPATATIDETAPTMKR
jgi:hypothetical protein